MTRTWRRLSAKAVQHLTKRGLYADGGNLFLQVARGGSRSWVLRYECNGQRRTMGLGSARVVSLAEAREKAAEARKKIANDIDPVAEKHDARASRRVAEAKAMTFAACAEAYVSAHSAGWRNAKHAAQWAATLKTYAYPVMGGLPVDDVEVGLVLKALEPIWTTKSPFGKSGMSVSSDE